VRDVSALVEAARGTPTGTPTASGDLGTTIATLLRGADARDVAAGLRDRRARERDSGASRGGDVRAATAALGQSAIDRDWAAHDRDWAAADRVTLLEAAALLD